MVQEIFFDNDKDQKTKRTVTITKGTRDNNGHKVKRQSISQEKGGETKQFCCKENVWLRATPRLKSGIAAQSARLRRRKNGREEPLCVRGQGRRLRGATPRPRSGAAGRRHPALEVRGGWEETPASEVRGGRENPPRARGQGQ